MKEKPILFSGEMVRAILDGRKTQTRRVVNPQYNHIEETCLGTFEGDHDVTKTLKLQYGAPGDRLWVKETFQPVQLASEVTAWRYRATDQKGLANWKPSIFCPRKASRINLEITAVRVERLQDISEQDTYAEGCEPFMDHAEDCANSHCALAGGIDDCDGSMVSGKMIYQALWESINGAGSWAKNPWVWVIEFKRV